MNKSSSEIMKNNKFVLQVVRTMDRKERLEIALKFCSMDLDALRPGDELNLQHDLKSFFGIVSHESTLGEFWDSPEKLLIAVGKLFFSEGGLGLVGIPISKKGSTSQKELKRIQVEANSYLAVLVDDQNNIGSIDFIEQWAREKGITLPVLPKKNKGDKVIIAFQNVAQIKGPKINISIRLVPWNDGCVLLVCGEVRDIFLTLLSLLARESGVHIRRCLECKKIFWGDPRKLYCSRPCANNAGVRNWRARSKEKRSEENHEKYLKRLAKRIGNSNLSKLKVQRRPRFQSDAKGGESK